MNTYNDNEKLLIDRQMKNMIADNSNNAIITTDISQTPLKYEDLSNDEIERLLNIKNSDNISIESETLGNSYLCLECNHVTTPTKQKEKSLTYGLTPFNVSIVPNICCEKCYSRAYRI